MYTNEDIQGLSDIQDIYKFARDKRKYWNQHIERMKESKLGKQTKTVKPTRKRTQGRLVQYGRNGGDQKKRGMRSKRSKSKRPIPNSNEDKEEEKEYTNN